MKLQSSKYVSYSDADLRIKMHNAVIIQDEVIKADKVIREQNELENFKRSQKKALYFEHVRNL